MGVSKAFASLHSLASIKSKDYAVRYPSPAAFEPPIELSVPRRPAAPEASRDSEGRRHDLDGSAIGGRGLLLDPEAALCCALPQPGLCSSGRRGRFRTADLFVYLHAHALHRYRSTGMAELICFRALGKLELTRGSITIPLLQRRRRFALFAFLAMARPPLRTRDSLHAMFWPESDHYRARKALNGAIYALRQELGDGVLVSRGDDEIGVAADIVWCDARAFDEAIEEGDLARGLDLYAGDLMAGFFVPGTYGFEHWLDSERDRLRRAAYDAAWQCAERAEQSGSLDEAVRWARRAAEVMFDDERGVRRSMGLLDRVCDRRGAIQMYEHFAQRLKEEYGTKPAPETRRLIATILARDEPRVPRDLSDERRTESASSRIQPAEPETTVAAALSSRLQAPVNPSEELTTEPPTLRETVTPAARGAKRRAAPRRVSSLFLAAAAIVIIAGVWSTQRLSIEVPGGSDSRGTPRVVISKFEPLSVDSEFALLSSAITVALTHQLAEVSGITVVTEDAYARSTSAQAGRPVSTAMSPFFLVRGSVLPSQTLVRVGVDLIDARSGSVLRSTRIERPAGDTLQLIDEVAQQVAGLLRIELGREIRLRRWRAGARSARTLELLHRAEIDRRRAQTLREQGDAAVAALHLARADSLLASGERQDPGWVDLTVLRAQVASEAAWLYSLAPLHDTALANEWLEAGSRTPTERLRATPAVRWRSSCAERCTTGRRSSRRPTMSAPPLRSAEPRGTFEEPCR